MSDSPTAAVVIADCDEVVIDVETSGAEKLEKTETDTPKEEEIERNLSGVVVDSLHLPQEQPIASNSSSNDADPLPNPLPSVDDGAETSNADAADDAESFNADAAKDAASSNGPSIPRNVGVLCGVDLDVNVDADAPDDIKRILEDIKRAADSFLKQWASFLFNPPPTINNAAASRAVVTMDDLFRAPDRVGLEELRALAFDDSGNQSRLSKEHVESIRLDGCIRVPSTNYPGIFHVWRMSKLFQKGRRRLVKKFWYDTAAALKLLIVSCKNRLLTRKHFSVGRGFGRIAKALYYSLELAVGLPYKKKDYSKVNERLAEMKTAFLAMNAVVPAADVAAWREYCRRLAKGEFSAAEILRLLPSALRWTPGDVDLDARLLEPMVTRALRRAVDEMFDEFCEKRTKVLRRFALRRMGELEKEEPETERKELVRRVNRDVADEVERDFADEVFGRVKTWPKREIETFVVDAALIRAFVDLAKSGAILDDERRKLANARRARVDGAAVELERRHPILYHVHTWRRRRLDEVGRRFDEEFRHEAEKAAVERFDAEGLRTAAHLQRRETEFADRIESEAKKKLEEEAPLMESFLEWKTKIWFSKNWGRRESSKSGKTFYYSVERRDWRVDRRRPFWRWTALFVRSWVWILNTLYWTILFVPFKSKLSLRALFSQAPFFAHDEVDVRTGALVVDKDSRVRTFASRLHDLWHHARKRRRAFEEAPDTGLLGKSAARPLNVVWNYGVKGVCGTIAVLLFFPAVCLITSTASLIVGALTPVLAPVAALLYAVFMVLVFDFDSPRGKRRVLPLFQTYLFLLLMEGVFQILLSLLAAIVILPLCSLVLFLFGLLWAATRAIWDSCCLHCVLRRHGRVPATDSWVAIRTQGPGLAANFLYRIRPEQALAAIKLQVELDSLQAYQDATTRELESPRKKLETFFEKLLKPLQRDFRDLRMVTAERILDEERTLKTRLSRLLAERRKTLVKKGIPHQVRNYVKLPADDLETTLACAEVLLKALYPPLVLVYSDEPVEDFFASRGLKANDWRGLARSKMAEVFTEGILTPLEDTAETFCLDTDGIDFDDLFDWMVTSDDDQFRQTLTRVASSGSTSPTLDLEWPPARDRISLLGGVDVGWAKALPLARVAFLVEGRVGTVEGGVEGVEGKKDSELKEEGKEEGVSSPLLEKLEEEREKRKFD